MILTGRAKMWHQYLCKLDGADMATLKGDD
jgi:hypothetical protein